MPLYIRSKATSIGVGTNWIGNFALTFFTPVAFETIQWRVSLVRSKVGRPRKLTIPQTFIIFGVFNVTSFFHVFLFFPETKRKTLEEMDEVFAQSIWAFKIKHTSSRLVEDIERVRKDVDGVVADIEELEQTAKHDAKS